MIYQFSLHTTGLAVGILLILGHAIAFFRERQTTDFVRSFPRSRMAATILLAAAAVWSFLLVRTIDLGEFSPLRSPMLVGIAAGAVLSWIFVEEFLAVRALGMLLLLAADPLLESAMLRGEPTRLLLVVLAYAWIVAGLFFVGTPYVLRDMIGWVSARAGRWKAGCLAGFAWGIALVACAILFW